MKVLLMKTIDDLFADLPTTSPSESNANNNKGSAKSIIDKNRSQNYLKTKGITIHSAVVLRSLFEKNIRDDHRIMPNDFGRSSLFLATDKRKPREFFTRKKIFHMHSKIALYYTGTELRAGDDELLWMQIIHYSIDANLGAKVSIPITQILKDLNLTRSKKNYDRIADSLSRLKATEIFIENQSTYGQSGGLSLIDNYVIDKSEGQMTLHVSIPRELVILYAGNTFTNLPWEAYKQLKPVSKRLLDYCYSHKNPNPLPVAVFSQLCTGSNVVDNRNALQNARRACAELLERGLVAMAFIENGTIFLQRHSKEVQ